MEKQLTLKDCENLKAGDVILLDVFSKDMPHAFAVKMKVAKYPITSNGRKCRSLGRVNKTTSYEYADEVGDTGNEEIMEYQFLGLGSFTAKSDEELKSFNARLIDKKHPLYDEKVSDSAKQFGHGFNMLENLFGGM